MSREEVHDVFVSLEDVLPPRRNGCCDACGERITHANRGPAFEGYRYCHACTRTE